MTTTPGVPVALGQLLHSTTSRRIEVRRADIIFFPARAKVNPTNQTIDVDASGLSADFFQAGGQALVNRTRLQHGINVGKAAILWSEGVYHCSWLAHTHVPKYPVWKTRANLKMARQWLVDCYTDCYQRAYYVAESVARTRLEVPNDIPIMRIAVPCLGASRHHNFPPREVAYIALSTALDFFNDPTYGAERMKHLHRIYFLIDPTPAGNALEQEFTWAWANLDVDNRAGIPGWGAFNRYHPAMPLGYPAQCPATVDPAAVGVIPVIHSSPMIWVREADILTFYTLRHAIVNPTNQNKTADASGLSAQIHQAAGEGLAADILQWLPNGLDVGEAESTGSFDLNNCSYIIHTHAPHFANVTPANIAIFRAQLYNCYQRSLRQVMLNTVNSEGMANGSITVAFPLISAGPRHGFPARDAAYIALAAVFDYFNHPTLGADRCTHFGPGFWGPIHILIDPTPAGDPMVNAVAWAWDAIDPTNTHNSNLPGAPLGHLGRSYPVPHLPLPPPQLLLGAPPPAPPPPLLPPPPPPPPPAPQPPPPPPPPLPPPPPPPPAPPAPPAPPPAPPPPLAPAPAPPAIRRRRRCSCRIPARGNTRSRVCKKTFHPHGLGRADRCRWHQPPGYP